MKVLVTGNRGYVGTVLTPLLAGHGHDVYGLDSDLFAACTFGGSLPITPTQVKDVRDTDIEDFEGFDAVVHLAGLSNDPLGDYRPELTDEINHIASVRVATLAKRAGVRRFIFASSCSNYGAAGDDFLTEDAAFNPVTPYGASKVAVERDVSLLADDDFCPVYLRGSTAYGVSPRIRFDLVLNNLVAWAYTTGRIYLKSDGSPWRPLVHVEDFARAYVAALEAPVETVFNEAFNVGSTSENYRVRELAEIVADTVPGCRLDFAPDAGPDKRNYRVDCNKICSELHGFKPQWTARRGAKQLYETYERAGLTAEEFEGPRFNRIAHVREQIATGTLTERLFHAAPAADPGHATA
jgi:nucleoside-diphosphate-sugar epimerase